MKLVECSSKLHQYKKVDINLSEYGRGCGFAKALSK